MLLLLVCIAGIFLGLYFNVFVLLPFSSIGAALFISDNLSSGLSFYANAGELLLLLFSLQAGYMLGLTGRATYLQVVARIQAVQSPRT
jgi:hypothetical protein